VTAFPAALPAFQAAGGSGVAFERVRIVLNNPDGSVALDTVVTFPAGATELQLTLSVPLPASAPASGLPLALSLKYVNAAGDTVFRGGPVTVTAVPRTPGAGPPPPAPVTIPIAYTGPGANAVAVRISPKTLTVNTGGAFTFSAQALDASGAVVPNTPIVFAVTGPATINAATGAGTAGSTRGTATVTAQLLTGPTDAATVTIVSPPASLAAVSGGGQTANVNATLVNPVVVQVLAADGLPAPGVAVAFAAQHGGSVGAASVTTGADGLAQTTWKLGPTAGAQTLTATAPGLTGSPVTFTATATALPPVRLDVPTPPPPTVAAGTPFGLVVRAVDATGALAPAFTGAVTVALGAGAPAGALLSGPTTVNAVAGVATFTGLTLNVPGTYTLGVSAPSLTGTTTGTFTVTAGAATKLVFQNYPILGAQAGAAFDDITVSVRDALNNPVTTFTGAVTITANGPTAIVDSGGSAAAASGVARAPSPVAHALIGTTTVNAVAGVATFSGLKLTAAGNYTLSASSGSLTAAIGPPFAITPAPASTLVLVSGGGQSVAGGIAFPNPIVVKVTDAFGNGVGGVTVNFTPASGTGTALPASAVSAAGTGLAQTSWTPIGLAGTKVLNVSGSGLLPNPLVVTGTATSSSGTARTWNGTTSTDWATASNWTPSGVPGAGDPITIPAGTPNAPTISAPSTIASLAIASGAQVTNNSTLTIGGSLTSGGGSDVIVGSGSVVLNGASGNLAASIHGTVSVTVSTGTYALTGFTEAYGPFTITSSGKLDVGAQELSLHGNLVTSSGGRLSMTNSSGFITVDGSATFGGGPTTGLLTAGTAYFRGAFSASGAAYATSGTHVTQFIGNSGGSQAIAYSPSTGSQIATVEFSGSDAKVLSGTPTFGNVTLASTTAQVSGAGVAATVSGNFTDNTSAFAPAGGWTVANTVVTGTNVLIDTDFLTTNLVVTGTVRLYGCTGGGCAGLRSDVGGLAGAPGRIAGLRVATTQAAGVAPFGNLTSSQFTQITGNVTVTGTGALLDLNGAHFLVLGNFSTASGGRLQMSHPSGYGFLEIVGNATFGGGSTTGLLTKGTIRVVGNFTEGGGAPDAFAPAQEFYTRIGDYYYGGGLRAAPAMRRAPKRDGFAPAARSPFGQSGVQRPDRMMPAERAAATRSGRMQADARNDIVTAARAADAARAEAARAARMRASEAHRAALAAERAIVDRRAAAYAAHGLAVPTMDQLVARAAARPVARGIRPANEFVGVNPVITFAHPTTSFFGHLYLEAANTTINSNVLAQGRLDTGEGFEFELSAGSPAGYTITSHGAGIHDLSFDNVRWVLLDGHPVFAMDYIAFDNMDPTVDQFTLTRGGDELAQCDCDGYDLVGWSFYTTPTTGNYIRATDTNGGNDVKLVMSSPYPAAHGNKVATAGGAAILNWPAALVRAFVSNTDGGDISVLEISDGYEYLADLSGFALSCGEPRNLRVNPAGTRVAVPCRQSDKVGIFDPNDGDFTTVITDASLDEPYAVAWTADGSELWIANKKGGGSSVGSITIVNASTWTVSAVLTNPELVSPEGIYIVAGRALVANRQGGTLSVFNVATRALERNVTVSGAPRDVVGTPDGQWAYVTTDGGAVVRVKLSDGTTTSIAHSGWSRNIAIAPNGAKVYVATQNSAVAVIDVATSAVSYITFSGASTTYGVAITNDGTLGLVTDVNLGKVFAFNPATGMEITDLFFPVSVGFGPRGITAY
jgi:hypothetical protein